MYHIFLKHKVNDYSAWRPVYDEDASRRQEAGMRDLAVYRDADDENMLLLTWEAENVDGFNQMMESEDLKTKMEEAGVISKPEVFVTESG